MESLQLLKEKISQGTEEQLNEVISKAVLKLTDKTDNEWKSNEIEILRSIERKISHKENER